MCESDMYFYIFVMSDDHNGANLKSERPATAEAIRHGATEPLVDSRIEAEAH